VARGQVRGDLLWNPFKDLLVKPDGTPFKIAYGVATLEVEPMAEATKMLEDYLPRFGLGPKGQNWTTFGGRFDIEAQVAWVEDMTATFKPDWFMIHSASAELLAPPVEAAVAQGISVFTLDCGIESDAVTSFIAHKFEGPGGTDLVGEWLINELVRLGYGPDNPVVVGELWGMREMKTSQLRHEGFHKATDPVTWITVLESADTNWGEELTATLTADMAIAHPEIKAFFHHGCGGAGMVPGLEGIGMLLPIGDPNHIVIVSNDAESAMWDGVLEGKADCFSTHGGVEPTDVCLQVAITNVIFGQPVEKFYSCPFIMVTIDNIDTVQIGGIPPAPGWPRGRWDTWLPMDPLEPYGFPQPSLALRQQYVGY
jgi:ABC-type sugar transport system substrate-binding protein